MCWRGIWSGGWLVRGRLGGGDGKKEWQRQRQKQQQRQKQI
jgi:hypothetical protein